MKITRIIFIIAGTAITTGFACGVVTPAALVCYGGAAMVGL